MRIIAKDRDYYDGVQAAGQDQTLLYQRTPRPGDLGLVAELVDRAKQEAPQLSGWWKGWNETGSRLDTQLLLVGFCGRLHVLFELSYRDERGKQFATIAHSSAEIAAFYQAHRLKATLASFTSTKNQYRNWKKTNQSPAQQTDTFVAAWDGAPLPAELFHCLGAPVFLWRGGERWGRREPSLTLDPNLAELEFFRKYDSFTAFQELAQYLAGVLGTGQPVTVTISDTRLAEKKGFDRTSFRTAAPGKKARRRERQR